MIPWIVFAVVAVPLVVVAFMASRRRTVASEQVGGDDAEVRARTEQEFAEAEAYEAEWRKADLENQHRKRLP